MKCKHCRHEIETTRWFDEEYPKVVYYHVKKEYAVLSYETHTRCDAIYYGIRCMYSKVASKRPKGCECTNPEPEVKP